jgi:hypothetical protein
MEGAAAEGVSKLRGRLLGPKEADELMRRGGRIWRWELAFSNPAQSPRNELMDETGYQGLIRQPLFQSFFLQRVEVFT